MIRGETTAAFGVKSAARAQPISTLPGFILLSVLLQEIALAVWIACVAANKKNVSSALSLLQLGGSKSVGLCVA